MIKVGVREDSGYNDTGRGWEGSTEFRDSLHHRGFLLRTKKGFWTKRGSKGVELLVYE